MLKTPKLAVLMSLVIAMGLFLAACSSSPSSVSDAISHPGDNYLGALKFEVNPTGKDIQVSSAASAVSGTSLVAADGFEVTTNALSITWDGAGTITGDISIKWVNTTNKVENVSIRAYAANAAGQGATLNGEDACGADGTIAGETGGGCQPGYTYVGDSGGTPGIDDWNDGAITQTVYSITHTQPKDRELRVIGPGCGPGLGTTYETTWSLTEVTAGYPTYEFYAHVYGDVYPADYTSDPRYDPSVASVIIGTYEFDRAVKKFPTMDRTLPINLVGQNQWFAVHVQMDAPGWAADPAPTGGQCADGNTTPGCDLTSFQQYDYYFVEDQANFDALTAAGWWQSYANYNTGYLYNARGSWSIQWDPGVAQVNGQDDTGAGATITTGFGSKINTIGDEDSLDRMVIVISGISNERVDARMFFNVPFDYATANPPLLGDGLDGTEYTGFQKGDLNLGYFALQAIGPSGSGTTLRMSPSGNTIYSAGVGKLAGADTGDDELVTQKSPNYPTWDASASWNEGAGQSLGHYNEQIGWICIQ